MITKIHTIRIALLLPSRYCFINININIAKYDTSHYYSEWFQTADSATLRKITIIGRFKLKSGNLSTRFKPVAKWFRYTNYKRKQKVFIIKKSLFSQKAIVQIKNPSFHWICLFFWVHKPLSEPRKTFSTILATHIQGVPC